ncbi:hypothetical protein F2P81_010824 [Scophthalmus maximus]|uniref:Uncharacterized protein n=1 Tax=Scophthalmus maximus TaxID=52904 RepID=A0A6A4T1N8_SCOMX|nr:hypothetical protein F2P81_010824 [Scophthalmus maximus]
MTLGNVASLLSTSQNEDEVGLTLSTLQQLMLNVTDNSDVYDPSSSAEWCSCACWASVFCHSEEQSVDVHSVEKMLTHHNDEGFVTEQQ